MRNEKCRSGKHYLVEYSPWYHMPVEGCDDVSNKQYPCCYEQREDKEEDK